MPWLGVFGRVFAWVMVLPSEVTISSSATAYTQMMGDLGKLTQDPLSEVLRFLAVEMRRRRAGLPARRGL